MIIAWRMGQLFAGLLLMGLLLLNGCMTFRQKDEKVIQYFTERGAEVSIRRLSFRDMELRYLATGVAGQPDLLVFVHGAPGSSKEFQRYLADSTLLRKARMISLDRPGYGYSNYGKALRELDGQVEAIRRILSTETYEKAILIGHSYGGPIVGKYAIDYPDRLAGIVMLAPVNDPVSEPMFWFAKFGKWRLTRWPLSGAIKVSADEKFSHVAELEKLAGSWSKIRTPVVHIHGYKDKLAPPANIDFSRRHIPSEYLKMIDFQTNHFIPWTDYDLVKKEILQLLGE